MLRGLEFSHYHPKRKAFLHDVILLALVCFQNVFPGVSELNVQPER